MTTTISLKKQVKYNVADARNLAVGTILESSTHNYYMVVVADESGKKTVLSLGGGKHYDSPLHGSKIIDCELQLVVQ